MEEVMFCFSYLGNLFFSEKLIHNQESILYGKQQLILLVGRLPFIGTIAKGSLIFLNI